LFFGTAMRAQHIPSGTRTSITLLLVLCLLFAQSLGLSHRIAHTHAASTSQVTSAETHITGSVLHDASISCIAFDEACVGASLHSTTFFPPLLPGAAVLSLWVAFSCWQQPFQRHFSSRAPPCA
jgi:hypothetical protein